MTPVMPSLVLYKAYNVFPWNELPADSIKAADISQILIVFLNYNEKYCYFSGYIHFLHLLYTSIGYF